MTTLHYVTVTDGVVTADYSCPEGLDPAAVFGVAGALPAPEGVRRGWRFDGSAFAPPAPSPAAVAATITTKADLYRRCTDAEAEAIDAAVQALPLRKRRIFEAAQYIASDDPDFDELRAGAVALFGEARAGELLAAS